MLSNSASRHQRCDREPEPGSATFPLRGNVRANDQLRLRGDFILTPVPFDESLVSTSDLCVLLPNGREQTIL